MGCVMCGGRLRASNPPRFRQDPDLKGAKWLLKNSKIYGKKPGRPAARVDFSLPPGGAEFGGSCNARTPACDSCYAQLGDIIHAGAAERRRLNMALFTDGPERFVDELVRDIRFELERPDVKGKVVRIHGFGDFFSATYVAAWAVVASRLPKVKFFGTTRTWQSAFHPSAAAAEYSEILRTFRSMPNVFVGASVEGMSYFRGSEVLDAKCKPKAGTGRVIEKPKNWRDAKVRTGPHAGMSVLEVLREDGYTIWNMLSEFSDPATRKRLGVKVKVGSSTGAATLEKVKGQVRAARAEGWMVGIPCKEQMQQKPDCASCMHCLHRSDGTDKWDVTFMFHPGKSKDLQVRQWQCRVDAGMSSATDAEKRWRATR